MMLASLENHYLSITSNLQCIKSHIQHSIHSFSSYRILLSGKLSTASEFAPLLWRNLTQAKMKHFQTVRLRKQIKDFLHFEAAAKVLRLLSRHKKSSPIRGGSKNHAGRQ